MGRWAAVLVLVTGCSMIALPGRGPRLEPAARSSCPLGAPVIDTAAAIIAAGAAVAVGIYDPLSPRLEPTPAFIAVFGPPAIIATVFAVSARHGWRARCECQRMFDDPVDAAP